MIKINVPYTGPDLNLKAGDLVELTGTIYCGRDMVLPYVVEYSDNGTLKDYGVDMEGAVIFHTAVSCAGIAPTTSSKPEIEGSIVPLSRLLPPIGMFWLVGGGALYTIGGVLYAVKWPGRNNPRFGCHEIFHVFILLGSVFHYLMMLQVILPLF